MATRHELIHIDFVANAGKANPVLQSLKDSCEEARIAKEKLDNALSEAKASNAPKDVIEKINTQLREQTKIYQALQKGVREYAKGIDTLSKGIKEFNEGTLDQMSPKFNKALVNSAKLAQSNFKSNTKEWSDLQKVIEAAQRNVTRAREDIDGLMQSMKTGASVSTSQLTAARDVLKDLAELAVVGSEDWRGLQKQMNEVAQAVETVTETERRLRGEIVDEMDAMRLSNSLTKESIAQRHAMGEAFVQAAQKERSGIEESMKGISDKMVLERQEREELKGTIELQENYDKLIEKRNKKIADAEERKQEAEKKKAEAQAIINAYDEQKDKVGKLAEEKGKLEKQYEKESQAAEKSKKVTDEQNKSTEELAQTVATLKGEIGGFETGLKSLEEQIKKVGSEPIKPKVDSSEVDALKAKLKAVQAAIAEKNTQIEAENKKGGVVEKWQGILDRLQGDKDGKLSPMNLGDDKQQLDDMLDVANNFYEIIKKVKGITEDKFIPAQAAEPIKQLAEYYKITEEEARKLVQTLQRSEVVTKKFGTFDYNATTGFVAINKNQGKDDHQIRIEAAQSYLAAAQRNDEGRIEKLNKLQSDKNNLEKQEAEIKDNIKTATEGVAGATEKAAESTKKSNEATGESIQLTARQQNEIKRLEKQNNSLTDTIYKLTKAREGLTGSQEEGAEAAKKDADAIKMTAEEAKDALDKLQEKSTFKFEGGKLVASNMEEAQLALRNIVRGTSKTAGTGWFDDKGRYEIRTTQELKDTVKAFQSRYQIKDDDVAKDIVKQLITGNNGGLIKSGTAGVSGGYIFQLDNDKLTERVDLTRELFRISKGVVEATNEQTAADKAQEVVVNILRDAHKKEKEALEERNEEYRKRLSAAEAMTGPAEKDGKKTLKGIELDKVEEYRQKYVEKQEERERAAWGKYQDAKNGNLDMDATMNELINDFQKQQENNLKRISKIKGEDTKATEANTKAQKDSTKATEEAAKAEKTLEELLQEKTQKEAQIAEKKKQLKEIQDKLAQSTREETAADKEQLSVKEQLDKTTEEYNTEKAKFDEMTEGKVKKKARDAIRTADDTIKRADETILTTKNEAIPQRMTEAEVGKMKKRVAELDEEIKKDTQDFDELSQKIAEVNKRETDAAIEMAQSENVSIEKVKQAIDVLKEKIRTEATDEQTMQARGEAINRLTDRYTQMNAEVAKLSKPIADRLATEDFGKMSETEIRQGIDAAKELVKTYQSGSDETKKLTENIVKAEEYLRENGIEAERAAQRQVADIRLMQDQLGKGDALTESALKAQVKYWQQLADDPKAAAEAVKQYTANLEQAQDLLTEKHNKTLEEKVQALSTEDLGVYSIDELQEGIEAAKEMQRTWRLSDEEVKQLSESIVAAEKRINEVSIEAVRAAEQQRENIRLMQDQLGKGDALTESALKAQVKYWQQLADDPKAAAEAVKQYTANLEQAQDLLTEKHNKTLEEKVQALSTEDLGVYSINELQEGIEAAKEMQKTWRLSDEEVKQLSEDIVRAETRINKVSIETERAAERQRESIRLMQDQLGKGGMSESALKAQERFWQHLIDDPKTAAESLENYRTNLARVQREIESQTKNIITNEGVTALGFFQRGEDENASAAEVQEKANALKKYRDSLPQKDDADTIAEIDGYLQKAGLSAKKAAGDVMSLDEALELAKKAGQDYYLSGGKEGFVASPQQIQAATKAIEQERDALIKTIQAKKANGNATKEEEKKLADLTKKLKDLKFEQDNLNMSQEKMQMLMKQPTEAVSLDELRSAIKRADGELKRMEDSMGKNSKQYKEFAEQVKQAKNQLKEMEGQAKATSSAWDKAWARLKTYVGMYMGFNMLWSKVTGTMDDMMTLSDKMGEVRKTTGFTADEVGRLSDNLTKLDTRTNLTGLMEFSSLAGSIGLKTQEAVQGFTEAANMIAVSLPEMGNEASRTLMKIADATGDLEKNGGNVRETLERVGSTIIALRANSAAAAGPITDFVSRVGAVGAQAGISIDQIAALGATVDALGGRVEMSATALSRMIPAIKNNSFAVAQALQIPERQLKAMNGMDQMVAVFRKLHDSVKGFDTSTEEGMNAMADAVEKALGRSTSMQEVMKTLNQQGARAGIVFGLLSQNVDKLEDQLDTASEAYQKNTALMDEYSKMNDTTAARWERMKNQIEEMFVSDNMQHWLGEIIEKLRILIDLISKDGPIGDFFRFSLVYFALWKAKWAETMGTALMSLGQFLTATKASTAASTADAAAKTAEAAATEGVAVANEKAAMATGKFGKALKANLIGLAVTAVAFLAMKLLEMSRNANKAATEQKRLNEAVSEGTVEAQREVGHLNNVIKALDNAKMSEQGRMEVLNKFKSDYSQYIDALGIEIRTVQDLKDNYDLLTGAIRRAAFERVRDRFKEQELEPLIKEAVEQGTDLQTGTNGVLNTVVLNDAQKATAKYSKAVRELTAKNLEDFRKSYRKEMTDLGLDPDKATIDQIKAASTPQATGRLTNQAIQRGPLSLTEYLAGKIDKGEIRDAAEAYKDIISKEFGEGEMFNATFDKNLNYVMGRGTLLTRQTGTVGGEETSAFNEKLYKQIEKFVTAYTKVKERGEQIDAAFSPYVGNGINGGGGTNGNGGSGGGGGTNPYGDYDKVKSAYSEWNGNDLVARRKEMLERVKALANGADVQAVLSEDAKFISEAVRKNIKTTEQAIEWYNTERLKIQDALHAKHLTNTGDWKDPKKASKRLSNIVKDEMKYYMDELDAYYTERKARIQEALNDEEISESEARNRTLANDAEWRQRRAELQQLYAKKAEKVAKEERDAIYDILSDRTGESVKYIKKDIANTVKFIEAVGKEKGKAVMDRILGDLDKSIEQDFLRQRNAIGQHMKAIQDIIDKERPFNGIVKNLETSINTMGILTAHMRDEEAKLMAENADMTDFNRRQKEEAFKELTFLLGEAENAYSKTAEQVMRDAADAGLQAWVDEMKQNPAMQEGLMAQLRLTFDSIQDAIKKEASLLKKEAENMWNNILMPDGKTTLKQAYDKTISTLGIEQGRVSRANSLIGAGASSERVADKLAIQQMKVQMAMNQAYYDLMRKRGLAQVELLKKESEELRKQGMYEEAKRKAQDAQHAQMSLNLATTKEQTELLKQQEDIIARSEESQNRLYKEMKEWQSMLTSSLQTMFEASHAGDAEYYNELAKLNLTGKGGPGAGTYIVIENEGTSDATAHYEYLNERQALERQRDIERQNAEAEAFRKIMDDINNKMNESITDWMNAYLQNQSIDLNTSAVRLNTDAEKANTNAVNNLAETLSQGIPVNAAPAPVGPNPLMPEDKGGNGGNKDEGQGTGKEVNVKVVNFEELTEREQYALGYREDTTDYTQISGREGIILGLDEEPRQERTEFSADEMTDRVKYAFGMLPEAEKEIDYTQISGREGELLGLEGTASLDMNTEALNQNTQALLNGGAADGAGTSASGGLSPAAQQTIAESDQVTETLVKNSDKVAKATKNDNKQQQQSTQSMFAKMTSAANLYGVAYQAMSNENLDTAQKFQMIALQAVGNAAIAGLQVALASNTAETATNMTTAAAKSSAQAGPIAGPILFAILSALVGGLMGLATSKVAKSKSQISQITGASTSAGRLSTGMLTYAEGNVNEFTDPKSLTPGRSYNVDAADGKTYRARYMGKNARTHITNGPEFHLVGEKGREAIIDAETTRLMQLDENGIWKSIQTLYNGGRLHRHSFLRKGRGVGAFADGNLDEFEELDSVMDSSTSGMGKDISVLKQSIDRQSDLLEDLRTNGIKAFFDVYGKGGLVDSYDTGKKNVSSHGERY